MHMRKAYFLTFINIFFLSASLPAQVVIHIRDKETEKPLAGAAIELPDIQEILATDEEGQAVIPGPFPRNIRISYLGYRTRIDVIREGGNPVISLEPEARMLDELAVVGYEDNRKLIDIPGAVHRLSTQELGRFDETSLLRSINRLPGVRMEERSPGSYRISIRGSSLRSPFDIRNVKVYWYGIPFTDPNGITPLNLLDLNQMERVEVVKGPAASAFGSGTGGVINIEKATYDGRSAGASFSVGSFGMKRYSAIFENGDNLSNYRLIFSRQQSDGQREHTAFKRTTAQLNGDIYSSEKHTLSGNIFFSDLFYQVPGGLNLQQFKENPRQARPGLPAQEASVDYRMFLASMKSEYKWNDDFQYAAAIYGSHSFFEMPFLIDFERETRLGLGGRASLRSATRLGSVPLEAVVGGEFQHMFLEGRNFENIGGDPGALRFDDEVVSTQGLGFLKADASFHERVYLTAGLSLNLLQYDIFRLVGAGEGEPPKTLKTFDPVLTPRFGLVYKVSKELALHGSAGAGFSPPSVKEIRTSDGVLNLDLAPERGTNFEIGFRGTLNRRMNFDVALFHFRLQETIVAYSDSLFATQKFRNAGSTFQNGIELMCDYYLIRDRQGFFKEIKTGLAYAGHRFRFHDYVDEGMDLSGNELTGAPPHTVSATMDLKSNHGGYLFLNYHFTDWIPLNDQNTVYSAGYQLVDLKAGWENQAGRINWEVYGGINNLLNETYSLGNDLNAFGERYYQPAAGRNYYLGLKVRNFFN